MGLLTDGGPKSPPPPPPGICSCHKWMKIEEINFKSIKILKHHVTFLRTILINASKMCLTRQKLLIVLRYGKRRFLNYWSKKSKATVRRFRKKDALKNFAKFERKHLCCSLFQEYLFLVHLWTAAFRNWNILRQNISPMTIILFCF